RTVLNLESTFDILPQGMKSFTVDAIGHDQTVKVEVVATGAPVNVFAYLAKDKAEAEKAIESRKPSPKFLKSENMTETVIWNLPIPANNEAMVMIVGTTKAANVKVVIKN